MLTFSISILTNISKIYERYLYNQIQAYFDEILSKHQCGFRKGLNEQHCLVSMIKKLKENENNGRAFGGLMTDLSKLVDCLHHGLFTSRYKAAEINSTTTFKQKAKG